jgi:hypothetical protein
MMEGGLDWRDVRSRYVCSFARVSRVGYAHEPRPTTAFSAIPTSTRGASLAGFSGLQRGSSGWCARVAYLSRAHARIDAVQSSSPQHSAPLTFTSTRRLQKHRRLPPYDSSSQSLGASTNTTLQSRPTHRKSNPGAAPASRTMSLCMNRLSEERYACHWSSRTRNPECS